MLMAEKPETRGSLSYTTKTLSENQQGSLNSLAKFVTAIPS